MDVEWGNPVIMKISFVFAGIGCSLSLFLLCNTLLRHRSDHGILSYFFSLSSGVERCTWTVPLRAFLIAIILLFMAEPHLQQAVRSGNNVLFVIDASASIAADQSTIKDYVLQMIKKGFNSDTSYGIILCGDNVVESTPFPTTADTQPDFKWKDARGSEMATNIAGGMARARTALGISQGGNVVLLTDGHAPRDTLVQEAHRLKTQGYNLEVVEMPCASPPDIYISSMLTPNTVMQHSEVNVQTVVENTGGPAQLKAILMLDNDVIKRVNRTFGHGTSSFEFSFPAVRPGKHIVKAAIESQNPESDLIKENNRRMSTITVHSDVNILFVEGAPNASKNIKMAITGSRITRKVVSSDQLAEGKTQLDNVGVIALVNIPARDIPEKIVAQLETFVSNGGGMIVYGGSRAFDNGGYRGSPIERLLPVVSAVRHPGNDRAVGVFILLIDVSGSMSGSPLQLAKQVGKEAINNLRSGMAASVIRFDAGAAYVAQPTVLNAMVRDDFLDKIDELSGGGGTDIVPAMQEALNALKQCRQQANRKDLAAHLLIISDGEAPQKENLKILAQKFSNQDCKVHTVMIGSHPSLSAQQLMSEVAKSGSGRAETYDGKTVPSFKLTVKEVNAERARLGFMKDTDDIVFSNSFSHPGSLPGMAWDYNRVDELKPTARLSLSIQDLNPSPGYVWQYFGEKQGRVMACLIDVEGIWSKGLLESKVADVLLGEPLYFIQRPAKKEHLRASLRLDSNSPNHLILTVRGHLPQNAALDAIEVRSPDKRQEGKPISVPLYPISPTECEGRFIHHGNKMQYKFNITKQEGEDKDTICQVITVLNPPVQHSEHVGNQPDRETLTAMSNVFGKQVKTMADTLDEIKPGKRFIKIKLWNWAIAVSLFLFLLVGTLVRVEPAKIPKNLFWLFCVASFLFALLGIGYEVMFI